MKRLLFICLAIIGLSSCEENDPVGELGAVNKQAPSIYLSPFQPVAKAGEMTTTEVSYWIKGERVYNGLHLWWKVDTEEAYELKISSISYSFKTSVFAEKTAYEILSSYEYDFSDWDPESKTYRKEVGIDVPLSFKTYTQRPSQVATADFISVVPAEVETAMYEHLAVSATSANHKKLLVEVLAVATEEEVMQTFNEDGILTAEGKTWLINKYTTIGISTLIDSYNYGKKHSITSKFEGISSFGVSNFSEESNINVI
ncbi:hypothetical protein [Sediminitomix flava]|uniref:Uncharacterized protein n=1 Tax=Sediminitomix flava TaxID=379075 RepID=A0A315ZE02_SEDFL|nr:hypothetical protein [Sediminitomix flava]PWJ43846.1 hypothetical protein BC781_101192 [Sediminitomix flava]